MQGFSVHGYVGTMLCVRRRWVTGLAHSPHYVLVALLPIATQICVKASSEPTEQSHLLG